MVIYLSGDGRLSKKQKPKCKVCGRRKDVCEFPVTQNNKLSELCMACHLKAVEEEDKPQPKMKRIKLTKEEYQESLNAKARLKRKRYPQEVRAYHRAYYHRNKEKILPDRRERTAEWLQKLKADPEKYAEHLAKISERRKAKRFNVPERYCNSCKKRKKKKHFDLETPTKWRILCRACYEKRNNRSD